MMSFSERIKQEAIDSFDNYIMQAVAPSSEEIAGVHEHNRFVEFVQGAFTKDVMLTDENRMFYMTSLMNTHKGTVLMLHNAFCPLTSVKQG